MKNEDNKLDVEVNLPSDGYGLSLTKQENGNSHTVTFFLSKIDVPLLTEEILKGHIENLIKETEKGAELLNKK